MNERYLLLVIWSINIIVAVMASTGAFDMTLAPESYWDSTVDYESHIEAGGLNMEESTEDFGYERSMLESKSMLGKIEMAFFGLPYLMKHAFNLAWYHPLIIGLEALLTFVWSWMIMEFIARFRGGGS
jgi:hypothetical protein